MTTRTLVIAALLLLLVLTRTPVGQGAVTIQIQETQPESGLALGQFWLVPSTGALKVYYTGSWLAVAAGAGDVTALQAELTDIVARLTKLETAVFPPPVDCEGTWSACVDGSQTFTITEQPQNGGAACPVSPRTCVVEPPPPPPPPPPPSGGNAYFDALVARADHFVSYSLRDPAQLAIRNEGGYSWTNSEPPSATYDTAMDAAKFVIPAGVNSLPNQVRVPLGTTDGHTYLATWEAVYDPSFSFANTGVGNYKTFQFDSPRTLNADGSVDLGSTNIWYEVNNRLSEGGAAGELRGRYYATATTPAGPGVTTEPLGPRLASFILAHSRWTRYWVLFEQETEDQYTRMTMWVADTDREAVKIFDRLPFTVLGGIQKFWVELNTSTTAIPVGRGDLIVWVRNIAVLRNVADVTPLLVKP